MLQMRYCILQLNEQIKFVEMPAAYAYQLTALHHRLNKEISKLTADRIPVLYHAIAECDQLELTGDNRSVESGLDYINRLEQAFAQIDEKSYPLISLLTEIRALQAQLEQWYEEEMDLH